MRYGIHILALEDCFGLQASLPALVQQITDAGHQHLAQIAMPDVRWGGHAPHVARTHHVLEEAAKLNVPVDPYDIKDALEDGTPQEVQAAVRTEAVGRLYGAGADRVLIMDPDELWRPGAFEHLHAHLDACETDAHYLRSIPVVGGYPIEGALDWALVYLRKGIPFRYSRGFKRPGEATVVRWTEDATTAPRRLYHFTGTRSSLREADKKYRGSSHFGEKHYELETWLRDTLPRLRPGMRDVSFFKDPAFPNFWPLVRDWSPAELEEIPVSLRSFCQHDRTSDPLPG